MVDVVKDLKSALKSLQPEIASILQQDFRAELNKNVHVLDLSYSTLLSSTYSRVKSSISERELAAYDKAHFTLVGVLKDVCASKTVRTMGEPKFKELFSKIKQIGPILILGDREHVFLVGSQFTSLQTYYSKNIANNPKLKSTRFGTSTTFTEEKDASGRVIPFSLVKRERIRTDFGHIPTQGDENLTSPLVKKLTGVINATNDPRIKSNAEAALNDLYKVQVSLVHRFKNVSPEAIENSRKILGSGYVVITLQNQKLNNKFSSEEGRIYFKLLRSIVNKIDYINTPGSNTIVQDIVEGMVNTISGNNKKLYKHKETIVNIPIELQSKNTVSTTGPKLETIKSQAVSGIAPLQVILNARLADQIKKNMGTGDARNVLNYRTGRLANSAKVERLTQSREGMISAFYSYMKYPYATFSEGGRQSVPRTRDPKLLISRSIREIGASMAYNRMRAVLV